MTDHKITPPPELVQQWRKSGPADAAVNNAYEQHIAIQSARWGADTELEACCRYIGKWFANPEHRVAELRTARRPKPPSLAERAVQAWHAIETGTDDQTAMAVIRRALERLQELENQ